MNEKRKAIFEELKAIQRFKNSGHITISDEGKAKARETILYKELASLPPEELQSYNIRLFTQPRTIRSKDGSIELQETSKGWIITKFAFERTGGSRGKPELILENGIPVKIQYSFISTETDGIQVTVVHDIYIDQEAPTPAPRIAEPVIQEPKVWVCSNVNCKMVNYDEQLFCKNCNSPKNEQVKKDYGLVNPYSPPQEEKKEEKKQSFLDKIRGKE